MPIPSLHIRQVSRAVAYKGMPLSVYDRRDPTRTTVLRQRFSSDARRRFRNLRGLIRDAIVNKDVFGLSEVENRGITSNQSQFNVEPRAFDFRRSDRKIESFMDWLADQVDEEILEIDVRRQFGDSIEEQWSDLYIRDSYKRGVMRSTYEMEQSQFPVQSIAERGGIAAVMTQPAHIDRLGVLFTRTFNDLKGITNAMDQQISRILAQGLADGDGPRLLARKLNATISGKGMGGLGLTDSLGRFIPAERRAQILARTEVIRAHHQGMMQTYKNWGVEGIEIMAELRTAGDNRVCSECSSLQGNFYTIKEASNLIPVHPQCRCIALPARRQDVEAAGGTFKTEGTTAPAQATPAAGTPTPNAISTPDLTDTIQSATTKTALVDVMKQLGFKSTNFGTLPFEEAKKLTKAANWSVQNMGDMKLPVDFRLSKSNSFLGRFEQEPHWAPGSRERYHLTSVLRWSTDGADPKRAYAHLERISERSGQINWKYKGATPEATVAHEMAHYFTYIAQNRRYFGEIDLKDGLHIVDVSQYRKYKRDWSKTRAFADEIIDETLENIGKTRQYLDNEVLPYLGDYAQTNAHETIAVAVQHAFDHAGKLDFADEIINVIRKRTQQ